MKNLTQSSVSAVPPEGKTTPEHATRKADGRCGSITTASDTRHPTASRIEAPQLAGDGRSLARLQPRQRVSGRGKIRAEL